MKAAQRTLEVVDVEAEEQDDDCVVERVSFAAPTPTVSANAAAGTGDSGGGVGRGSSDVGPEERGGGGRRCAALGCGRRASAYADCVGGHALCPDCCDRGRVSSGGCCVAGCRHPMSAFSLFCLALAKGEAEADALLDRWGREAGGTAVMEAVDALPRCPVCLHCPAPNSRGSSPPARQSLQSLSRLSSLVADAETRPSHVGCDAASLFTCPARACGAVSCRLCKGAPPSAVDGEEHFLALLHLLALFLQQQLTTSPASSSHSRPRTRRGSRKRAAPSAADDGRQGPTKAAKGTGYGGSAGAEKKRDPRALKAQEAADEAVGRGLELLVRLLSSHRHLLLRPSASARALFVVLRGPVLPVLLHFAHNQSLLDMTSRHEVFLRLLRLLALAGRPELGLACLLVHKADAGSAFSLHSLLASSAQQGRFFLQQSRHQLGDEEPQAVSLCADLCDADQQARTTLATCLLHSVAATTAEATQSSASPSSSPSQAQGGARQWSANAEEKETCDAAKLELIDLQEGAKAFSFASQLSAGGDGAALQRSAASRLRKEWAGLSSGASIPDGVFVRVDEARIECARVCIVGPRDTPYENGLFFFDLWCPPTYPAVPPAARFLTTAGGRFRFNPNLYADGKVCLSLLGTWQGQRWSEKESSILQVLLSIQAMILVPQPVFNEPGYESMMGTPQGAQLSKAYNDTVRRGTVQYALVDAFHDRHVTRGFEGVVRAHFARQRERLIRTAQQWLSEARLDAAAAAEAAMAAAAAATGGRSPAVLGGVAAAMLAPAMWSTAPYCNNGPSPTLEQSVSLLLSILHA